MSCDSLYTDLEVRADFGNTVATVVVLLWRWFYNSVYKKLGRIILLWVFTLLRKEKYEL